jgi:hypothetical protein
MLGPLKDRRRRIIICVVEEIEQAVRLIAGSVSVCPHRDKPYHRESLRIELEIERNGAVADTMADVSKQRAISCTRDVYIWVGLYVLSVQEENSSFPYCVLFITR